jgi:hypothetical protein
MFFFTYNSYLPILYTNNIEKHQICVGGTNPIFVSLQYGSHYHWSSKATINGYIVPRLAIIDEFSASCPQFNVKGRLRVVFIGLHAITDSIIKKYPHQNHESTKKFNSDIAIFLEKKYKHVKFINFFPLTLEALNRTSDGFHHLRDINVIKALTILHIMDLMTAIPTRIRKISNNSAITSTGALITSTAVRSTALNSIFKMREKYYRNNQFIAFPPNTSTS